MPLLFTHPHKDHIGGMDDVRAFNFFLRNRMKIYADSLTEEALRREFYYAFSDTKYPGTPELNLNTITMDPFIVGDIPVIPVSGLAFENAGDGFPVWQVYLYHRCQPDR